MKKCIDCENLIEDNKRRCVDCQSEKNKEYYQNNKERILKKGKEYYQNNKTQKKEYQKDYSIENREIISERNKERHIINRERNNESSKQWWNNNKKHIKEYLENTKERRALVHRKWKEENRDKLREYNKNYKKQYREKNKEKVKEYNKNYRSKNLWSYRYRDVLRGAIDRLGKIKQDKTINILGYSALDFKIHIENLFTENMSWDKRDSFEIDHIIPITHFKENTPFNIVNSLENLMPLVPEHNQKKSNSINENYIFLYEKYFDYIIAEVVEILKTNYIKFI